jgi:hypothetical protein
MIVPFVNVCKYKKFELGAKGNAGHNIMFSLIRANVQNCSELFWVLAGRGKEEGTKKESF